MANVISRRSIIYDIVLNTDPAKKSSKELGGALDKAGESIRNRSKDIDKFAQGLISAATRLKQIKNELNNFKGSQAQFIALNKEAAKLTDQIQKTNQRIAVLASSTKNFQAVASAVSGLTGIFTAAQGAAAVFGKESEGLQRSLVKLQGSLALLQGVQAAVATITEQSAAKTVFAEKAQAAYNLVVGQSVGALKAFRLAMAASVIGLAVVGIIALVEHWEDLKAAITGVSKEQSNLNEAKAEGFQQYAEEATKIDILIKKYGDQNASITERQDILNELNQLAPEYFGNLDAEKTKVEDLTVIYEKLVKALVNKGAAEILTKRAAEIQTKLIDLQNQLNEAVKNPSVLSRIPSIGALFDPVFAISPEIGKLQRELATITNQIIELTRIDTASAFNPAADSIDALNAKLATLREEFNRISPTSARFGELRTQIEDLEEQIKKLTERAKAAKLDEIIQFDPEKLGGDVAKIRKIISDAFGVDGDLQKELGEDGGLKIKPKVDLSGFDALREELGASKDEFATFAEEIEEIAADLEDEIGNSILSAAEAIFEIARNNREHDLQEHLSALNQKKEAELEATDLSESGKRHIQEKYRRLEAQAKIQAFNANKQAAINEALINGALGATKTIAQLGFPAALPALLAEATAVLAQVAIISSQQPPEFAEGVIDLHQPGEIKGKDSIHAKLMPGESVIRTDRTQQYKPELTAIQAGSLEELIQVKYVEPALALKALDNARIDSTQPDYSDKFYRQYLATGEGNITNKRAVRILASIDQKLSQGNNKRGN